MKTNTQRVTHKGSFRRYRSLLVLTALAAGIAMSSPRQGAARTLEYQQCMAAAAAWGSDCRSDGSWLKQAGCRIVEGAWEVACVAAEVARIMV